MQSWLRMSALPASHTWSLMEGFATSNGLRQPHLLSSTTPDKKKMNRKDAYTSPMNACMRMQ